MQSIWHSSPAPPPCGATHSPGLSPGAGLLRRTAAASVLWVAGLALASCSTERLRSASGAIEIEPESLQFPPTWAGSRASLPLRVSNSGRSRRAIRLDLSGPFTSVSQTDIGPGESIDVSIEFVPVEEGAVTGRIEVDTDPGSASIPLRGEGRLPPECPPSGACLTTRFDHSSGACVSAPVANGMACDSENKCLGAGRCLAGACVGAPRACDDRNPCTMDACDPSSGCVHREVFACGTQVAPCQVASCDKAAGCLVREAPDGTLCGPISCASARFCRSGVCESFPVPDGTPCTADSPCQKAGTCRTGACVKPAPSPLESAWSVPGLFYLTGVSDETGTSFVITAVVNDGPAALAAVSRDGAILWRTALGLPYRPYDYNSRLVVLRTAIGIAVVGGGRISLYRESDGQSSSVFDVGAMLKLPPGPLSIWVAGLRATGELLVTVFEKNALRSWLARLSLATGRLTVIETTSGYLYQAIADEKGSTYELRPPLTPPGWSVTSRTAGGTSRWAVGTFQKGFLAVGADLLVMATGEVLSTLDGTRRFKAPVPPNVQNFSVALVSESVLAGVTLMQPRASQIDFHDSRTGAFRGTRSFTHDWIRVLPVLTSRETVLYATAPTATQNLDLRETRPDGSDAWVCPVSRSEPLVQMLVHLLKGRLVLANALGLEAYDLPGLELAPKGWVAYGGGPNGGFSPR